MSNMEGDKPARKELHVSDRGKGDCFAAAGDERRKCKKKTGKYARVPESGVEIKLTPS